MTDWYVDSEFVDTGRTIDLISFALVSENVARGYWINGDDEIIDRAVYDPWLRANVVKHLPVRVHVQVDNFAIGKDGEHPSTVTGWDWDLGHPEIRNVVPKKLIAQQVQTALQMSEKPQLWAWYSAYDHVVLAQLFGRMIDLPAGIPMLTQNLKQECLRLGDPQVPAHTGRVHHALDDAVHDKEIAEFLAAYRDN